jgi:hypothetical protein
MLDRADRKELGCCWRSVVGRIEVKTMDQSFYDRENKFVGPCACEWETEPRGSSPFCGPQLALSKEEEGVLTRMRVVHKASLQVRETLARLDPILDRQVHAQLQEELQLLRQKFAALKEELAFANEQKLRRLGHLP